MTRQVSSGEEEAGAAPSHPDVSSSPARPGTVAEVENLAVTFRRGNRRIHAVRGVSLDIRPGEILGLVGESGSGKSVLGMSLLGLLPEDTLEHTSGRVAVADKDMLHGSADVRRRVRKEHLGSVFQDPMTSLNPTMRVGRQVIEAAGSTEEAIRLLRAVGIPDAERRISSFPHELSGGLRQRVMIAMAVAGNPSLVIADEPTTALDVMVQSQVLTLLRSLVDEIGCSFLLITHDLGVAAQVADRIAVMYAGRLAELGPTDTVLRSAAHPYSLGLMRSRLSLTSPRTGTLTTLRGEVPNPAAPPPGCPFQPRCDLATDDCTQLLPDPVAVIPGHLSACVLPAEVVRARRPDPDAAEPESTAPFAAEAPGAASAVRVRQIRRTFRVKAGRGRRKDLQALREIDLDVAAGESVAIVGESGSGKSTLLRVMAGLERADHGEVALGGSTRPQMVFQDAGASLTPWMTVGALIDERLRGEGLSRAERQERVAAALAQVGLPPEVAQARSRQLSGGQRQRVALARATVIPPQVLLCDEPTSALDVSLAAGVLNLIGQLRRQLGMAVVFVTHDLSVARIVGDRIAVMYLGNIVELGPAERVVSKPAHPYTKALLSAVPEAGAAPMVLTGEPASPLAPPSGCAFHPRCPLADDACADSELRLRPVRLRTAHDRAVACLKPELI
ncbi:dipeptide ABC transporter ATP-binding protein [Actinacidiphila oryziradicis]|uniref:ABC transporter ATP-binding protein n=1 Tax=Actinacidiphila oryziradicis TaxID=2571141 RepID=A0A4U0SRS9_9ACTN|nr:ABC transporter ATP-binding protein [Actinacidiphila oryziradicis]TKA11051.1 ABC transporter ATP-binding protein [Actinacidiphila oryziradicis]